MKILQVGNFRFYLTKALFELEIDKSVKTTHYAVKPAIHKFLIKYYANCFYDYSQNKYEIEFYNKARDGVELEDSDWLQEAVDKAKKLQENAQY